MSDQNKDTVSKLELYMTAMSVSKSELYMAVSAIMTIMLFIQGSIVSDSQWFKVAVFIFIAVAQVLFYISARANKTLETELTELKEKESKEK